ncbi:MAG TPA: hypothetical protein VIQ53_11875, partial [Inquilinus sp.]
GAELVGLSTYPHHDKQQNKDYILFLTYWRLQDRAYRCSETQFGYPFSWCEVAQEKSIAPEK